MANSINSSGAVDLTNQLAMDANGLSSLKRSAKADSPEAIKGVAKQFEAVFVNMMLKSMRDATPKEGAFDSEQSKMFTSMLDQQLSQTLAGKGIGLADVLVRQLSKAGSISAENALKDSAPVKLKNNFNAIGITQTLDGHAAGESIEHATKASQLRVMNAKNDESTADGLEGDGSGNPKKGYQEAKDKVQNITATELDEISQPWMKEAVNEMNQAITALSASSKASLNSPSNTFSKETIDHITATISNAFKSISTNFTAKMAPYARRASMESGLPAHFMMGQAALETGWGKKEINGLDGLPSNNLFGIKANASWTGKVVSVETSEYINGVKQQRIEKFRAYDSYADSFKDFANMIKNSPRYQNVMNNLHSATHYAQAVQNAGYSTDPQYANKLASTIKQISP